MTKIPYIVTDHEADESIRKLKTGSVVPAQEFFVRSAVGQPDTATVHAEPADDQLSSVEPRFITAVVNHPMRSASEYIKLARISPNTLSEIRPGLVDRGFIREHKLEVTSGRGRARIKLEPLEPAKKIVANLRKG